MSNRSLSYQVVRPICIVFSIAFAFLLRSGFAMSQESPVGGGVVVESLHLGFSGMGRVGNWLPLQLKAVGGPAKEEVSLFITASDPRGDLCDSVVAVDKCDSTGGISLSGVFITGRLDGLLRLRLEDSAGKILWQHSVTCEAADSKSSASEKPTDSASPEKTNIVSRMTLMRHHTQTVLAVGFPAGLQELSDRLTSTLSRGAMTLLSVSSIEDLPTSRQGLDSVDTVLLVTEYGVSERQTMAIQDWVMTGGHFIVSCGENLPQLIASPVGAWLQPEFGIQDEVRKSQDLTALQNYVAGASQLQTNRQNVPIVQMNSDQPRVIVSSINGPLISRIGAGAGFVTIVAVDLNLKPLNRWLSLSQFYEMLLFDRLLDAGNEQANRRGRISSSGVTDLATQLANASDAIPEDERWSSWHTMLMMLVYLIIIGPLDYFLVVRLLHRPKLTWLTFPLLVATACGLTAWWSTSHRALATVREVHLLDVGQDRFRQTLHKRSWSSLSTADARYGRVAAKPLPVIAGESTSSEEETLIWHGRAEDVYGGLYRSGGAGLGQKTSRRLELNVPAFTSVPLMVDGSQAFLAESLEGVSINQVFESRLSMPASGLLEGSFVHHLPAAIEDWVIVLGNRVYLPSQKAEEKFRRIEPNEPWSRDSGGVRISEIRDFLRGVRLVSRERTSSDKKNASTTTQIQATYDTRGTNPLDILLMISLYDSAGGENYCRLQDDYLRRDEVSDTIQLNTALLIGLVDLPLTQLQLDDQAVEPAESRTVVRFFLPVSRTGTFEAVKEADPKAE